MATTTFNTRISLKYDTYANWIEKDPVLLEGELAVVVVPAATGAVAKEPAILFKVGDGSSKFSQLQFAAGLAADVYDWAKAAAKPEYTAAEITGLADYISGKVQDTNTQYKLEQDASDAHILKLFKKDISDADWSVVTTITTADTVYDDTALAGRMTALEGLVGSTAVATQIANAITALDLANTYDAKGAAAQALTDAKTYADGKIGTVPDGNTVVQMIADAQDAATYDDTALKGRVSTLEGTDAGKSVRTIANEELAAQLIPESAAESLDTLQEIAAWIQAHPGDAATMNEAITALQAIVDGIGGEGEKATVVTYVTDAIAALKIGDYAKAADLTALAGRVTTAEGKITDLETEITKKANDADLAAVAKSGNVNDLAQTEGDYVIFNCGSSSTVI